MRGFRSRMDGTGPGRAAIAVACAASLCVMAACTPDVAPLRVEGGNAERGKALVAQYQCGACHAIPGVSGARGMVGPTLDRFGRRSYIAGHIPNLPDNLVRWLVNPPAMVPGTPMPAMGLSEDEARHMAAYLYTLE